jgi:hypothetical protein
MSNRGKSFPTVQCYTSGHFTSEVNQSQSQFVIVGRSVGRSVSQSVCLGFESLIGTPGHILAFERMSLFCVSWCTLPDGWRVCHIMSFVSRRGQGIFLFTAVSRTALGPTQPPIQWVPGSLSLGVKRPGREADHSPPSSAEVKE